MARNIAIVGCGAIAQTFYLPMLAKLRDDFDAVWLVDPGQRAVAAASAIVPARSASRLADVADDIQFVIASVPNSLHFAIAQEAMTRGAHVLIEKPFVVSPQEGRALLDVAVECGRVLAINQTRRFFPSARELRKRVAAGAFGALRAISHLEGGKLAWPFESGAAFAKTAQRTGVIMDLGIHVLDFYHYVLQPDWTFARALHDGFEGPEGLAELEVAASGAPVSLRLSRYLRQENVARLTFEGGEVFLNVFDWNAYTFKDRKGVSHRFAMQPAVGAYPAFAEPLLRNFIAAGEGKEAAACDATGSLPVITLLDEVYRGAACYPDKLGDV